MDLRELYFRTYPICLYIAMHLTLYTPVTIDGFHSLEKKKIKRRLVKN